MNIKENARRIAAAVPLAENEWLLVFDGFAGRVTKEVHQADMEVRFAVGCQFEEGTNQAFGVTRDFWSRVRSMTPEEAEAVIEMNNLYWSAETNETIQQVIAEKP
jgi:hypothetical protein